MALGITEEEFRYPVDYNPDIDFTNIIQSQLLKFKNDYMNVRSASDSTSFDILSVTLARQWLRFRVSGGGPTIKSILEPWGYSEDVIIDMGNSTLKLSDVTEEDLESNLPDTATVTINSTLFDSTQSFMYTVAPYTATAPFTMVKLNTPFESLVANASWLAKGDWYNVQPWVSLNTIDDYYYVIGFKMYASFGTIIYDLDDTLLPQNALIASVNYKPLTESEKEILSQPRENPLIFKKTLGELRAMRSDGMYPELKGEDFIEPFGDIIDNHIDDLTFGATLEFLGFKVKAPFKDAYSWTEIEPINREDWVDLVNQRVQQDIDKYKSNGSDQDVALFNDDIKPSGVLSYDELLEYIDEIEEGGWFYERIAEEGVG